MLIISILPASEIINSLLLGGLLGLVGQGVRTLVGVKKMREENSVPHFPPNDFNTSRLIASLVLGFAVGILATIPFFAPDFTKSPQWSQQVVLTLVAAGYSGTDFIEGFLKNYLTKPNSLTDTTDNSQNKPTVPSNDNSLTIDSNQTVAG